MIATLRGRGDIERGMAADSRSVATQPRRISSDGATDFDETFSELRPSTTFRTMGRPVRLEYFGQVDVNENGSFDDQFCNVMAEKSETRKCQRLKRKKPQLVVTAVRRYKKYPLGEHEIAYSKPDVRFPNCFGL